MFTSRRKKEYDSQPKQPTLSLDFELILEELHEDLNVPMIKEEEVAASPQAGSQLTVEIPVAGIPVV